jgi:hypothetical protein
MIQMVYWPVYWTGFEDGPRHMAFFDNEDMARHIAGLFETTGLSVAVHPPVHLSIFNTFLPPET